ncbi:MAG: GNAT family N-acetyltransferase [Paramuribaculum sp.]|nr:GNAT family N-acetyltransferase [Paramuribaculum sp.]
MVIRRYTPADACEWDDFVNRSRCGTFLFRRGYMDYHADRFTDCSLMAYNHRGKLIALLPAETQNDCLSSHRGLTYGGWIAPVRHFYGSTMVEVFDSSLEFMRDLGITRLDYKPLPYIYSKTPDEEDIYALFRHGAVQTDCVLSSVIDLRNPAPMNESTRQAIRLAASAGITIHESADFHSFWKILEERLATRHNAHPVHTAYEITLLAETFPENIRLIVAKNGEIPVAGAVLYLCDQVIRVQYMASTEYGRRIKALTLLMSELISRCTGRFDFIDMGGSNEPHTNALNTGLLLFKSGLGGRGVAFPAYRINL